MTDCMLGRNIRNILEIITIVNLPLTLISVPEYLKRRVIGSGFVILWASCGLGEEEEG